MVNVNKLKLSKPPYFVEFDPVTYPKGTVVDFWLSLHKDTLHDIRTIPIRHCQITAQAKWLSQSELEQHFSQLQIEIGNDFLVVERD